MQDSPRFLALFLAMALAGGACRDQRVELKSPPDYNFAKPSVGQLPSGLDEISGIAWDERQRQFVANQDESGDLFFLDPETYALKSVHRFGRKGDYEDIALVGRVIYLLRSDGTIVRVLKQRSGGYSGAELGRLDLSGRNDFESMYYDQSREALVMICKNCKSDRKRRVSAYAFDLESATFADEPLYWIDADRVSELAPRKAPKLQPSAAGIHPVSNKLFILSSASNQLVLADLDGRVESVFVLTEKRFPQPEGLTFNDRGDMFISNEALRSRGTLLGFTYEP